MSRFLRAICILSLLAADVIVAQRGGRGGPGMQDIKILKQFDKNKDGWLNTAERKEARTHVTSSSFGRPPFPMRGGGFGAADAPGERIAPADVKTYPNSAFYDESVLRTLFLTFDESDWEKELQEFHGTDVDVPSTVMVDGKSYHDVGVRFRGMSSYGGVPEGRKRSFNLTVDMADSNQNIGGYRTLNLLNAHEDPSFMRAVLFLHIAREYIPAPKANFVRVVINGENWGIYENVQQFNKDFLKENYKDTGGARWKAPGPNPRAGLTYLGENKSAYSQAYEIKTKDEAAQWTALIHLTKVLNETPADQLEKALAPILDIDETLRYLALDNALVNNDGYWTRASDYSLYRDEGGKFHIIPHDTNETFSAGRGGGPRGPGGPGGPGFGGPRFGGPGGPGPMIPGMGGGTNLDPLIGLQDYGKPIRSRLLAVPALREKYLSYVRQIATKWLDWKTLDPLVEQYRTLIDADVKRDTRKLESYDAFVSGVSGTGNNLKTFAAARLQYLSR